MMVLGLGRMFYLCMKMIMCLKLPLCMILAPLVMY